MTAVERPYKIDEAIEDASILIMAGEIVDSQTGCIPNMSPENWDQKASILNQDQIFIASMLSFDSAEEFTDKTTFAIAVEYRRSQIMRDPEPENIIITDPGVGTYLPDWFPKP